MILDDAFSGPRLDERQAALAGASVARGNAALATVRTARNTGYVLAALLLAYGAFLAFHQELPWEGGGIIGQAVLYAGLAYGTARRPLLCLSVLLAIYVIDQLAGLFVQGASGSGLALKVLVIVMLFRGVRGAQVMRATSEALRGLGYTPGALRPYRLLRPLPPVEASDGSGGPSLSTDSASRAAAAPALRR